MKLIKYPVALLALASTAIAKSAPIYEVEILGNGPEVFNCCGAFDEALTVNNKGQVLIKSSDGTAGAFLFDPSSGEWERIGGGNFYQSLSESGIVVGARVPIFDSQGASRLDPDGTQKLLQVVSGNSDYGESVAISANTNGDVVGAIGSDVFDLAADSGVAPQAFIWGSNDEIHIIGSGSAVDINERGLVLGTADTASVRSAERATGNLQVEVAGQNWLWTETGGRIELGISGGFRINDEGQILGNSGNESYLFDLLNGYQGLGFEANDLNNLGQAVGGTTLWDPLAGAVDIFDLLAPPTNPNLDILSISNLVSINDFGQILTSAEFAFSRGSLGPLDIRIPVLLNPATVPEPSTIALFFLGLFISRLNCNPYKCHATL